MPCYLGFDTSNYAASVSLYNSETGNFINKKQFLPVPQGQAGLRQNEAVFHHNRLLPAITQEVLARDTGPIAAAGASERPRDVEGSYMPCFLAGAAAAQVICSALRVPYYSFSHQQGHIAAALAGTAMTNLLDRPFIGVHASGGTTEILRVTHGSGAMAETRAIARARDLNAGQVIDRVALMLGLPFPGGEQLTRLALQGSPQRPAKVSLKENDCCLSGLENLCRDKINSAAAPEDTAAFCLESLCAVFEAMLQKILSEEKMPVLFFGGVSSSDYIRRYFSNRFEAYFAPPEYSSDNAAGIAYLVFLSRRKER